MAYVIGRQGVTLRDCRGHTGKTSFYYNYDAATAANVKNARDKSNVIISDIIALSNALVVGQTGLTSQDFSPLSYGANSTYANCETKALLTFMGVIAAVGGAPAKHKLIHLSIPAPVQSMFYADRETVNPAVTAVAQLITDITAADATSGTVCSEDGATFTSFVAGILIRRKFQRRLTIYDKDPNLTEPEE
jgi:hypothetical protein